MCEWLSRERTYINGRHSINSNNSTHYPTKQSEYIKKASDLRICVINTNVNNFHAHVVVQRTG